MNTVWGLLAGGAAAAFALVATRSWRGPVRLAVAALAGYAGVAGALLAVGVAAAVTGRGLLRPAVALPTVTVLLAAASGATALVARRRPVRERATEPDGEWARPVRWEQGVLLAAGVVFAAALVAFAVHPPGGYDALSYHLPAAALFARTGHLSGPLHGIAAQWAAHQPVGNFPLAYPGTVELVEGMILQAFGEHLVWLPQAGFAVVLALCAALVATRLGGRPWLPFAAVLLCPVLLFQAGTAYSDLVAAGCLAVAVVAAGGRQVSDRDVVVACVACGLAAATKTVVLPVALAVLVVALVRGRRRPLVALGACGLAVLAPTVWLVRDAVAFGNPLFPLDVHLGPLALRGLPASVYGLSGQQRNFVPTPLAWPVYPLFEKYSDTSGFGAAFAVLGVPAAVAAGLDHRVRRHPLTAVVALVVVVSLAAAVVFPLPSPRFQLLPVALLLGFTGLLPATATGGPLHVGEYRGNWNAFGPRSTALLACLCVGVTAAVAVDRISPVAAAPIDRSSFYAERWYTEPAVSGPGVAAVWDDVSWSDYGFPSVYPLMGPHHDRVVTVGLLGGWSPETACADIPTGTALVYVVADASVAVRTVDETYRPPWFEPLWTVSRRGPHGVQRRSLWRISALCARLARARG